MGVKDLWNILAPVSERKPLFELQGKTIAIDLSCWIIDSQSITENTIQPKIYLRNLFFRTSHFLLHDIFPVFVLEGTAPSIKHNTIAKRNKLRYNGQETKTSKMFGRLRFNYIIKECEEMLKYMGIACVKGYGEAEAMCAYLNEDGLVNGCITQDSDCFLYGGKKVYRNYCTSTQGNRTTSAGYIDEYCMNKIEKVLHLGRNKMIALALLCGCDYDDGVNGVGKEAALKLFKITEDYEILDRMLKWRKDSKFTKMENKLLNPNICTNCGHTGKIKSHTRIGCVDCGTLIKCCDSYKQKRTLISNELAVRKKALLMDSFPNQNLINEFLIRKGPVPTKLDLEWGKPKIIEFVQFMEKKVLWDPNYTFEKIFPLVTRWQLINIIKLPIEQPLTIKDVFIPLKIKKVRNIRSIASYEILWSDKNNVLKELTLIHHNLGNMNHEEKNSNSLIDLVTLEPQHTFFKCYPNIVEIFNDLNNKKKEGCNNHKTTRNSNIFSTENNLERQITYGEKISNMKKKKKKKFLASKNNQPTLGQILKKSNISPKKRKQTNIKSQFDNVMKIEFSDTVLNGSLETMFHKLTSQDFSNDINNSMDMSIIINNICNSGESQ